MAMARSGKRKKTSKKAATRKTGASTKPSAKNASKNASKIAAKTAPKRLGKSKSPRSKSASRGSSPEKTKTDALDALISAAADALALTIEPAWRPAVRANLQVIFSQAALFAGFALPDDAEPAPIFRA
jgi:Protein of unknown function (DUF4089)